MKACCAQPHGSKMHQIRVDQATKKHTHTQEKLVQSVRLDLQNGSFFSARPRSVLFRCQSHDFPVNLSQVLLFFCKASLLGTNITPLNRIFGNLSPPKSYFCCLSVRPNCLFPNNVPLFSVPTLCDFSPITLFSR